MGLTGQLSWSSGAAGFERRMPLQHCTVTLLHTDLIQSDLFRVISSLILEKPLLILLPGVKSTLTRSSNDSLNRGNMLKLKRWDKRPQGYREKKIFESLTL